MKKVLYFSTTWCGPCKVFKPIVEQVSRETGVNVTYIDAEQDPEMAKKYNVASVPTVVIIDPVGTMLYRNAGVMQKGQLSEMFRAMAM